MWWSSEVQLSKIYYSLIFYTYSKASPSYFIHVEPNFTKPSASELYITARESGYGNDVHSSKNGLAHGKRISGFPSKGLYNTNSLYLQRLQNQISESCQLCGQQALWNLVHTHWRSGSQWLIMILKWKIIKDRFTFFSSQVHICTLKLFLLAVIILPSHTGQLKYLFLMRFQCKWWRKSTVCKNTVEMLIKLKQSFRLFPNLQYF